MLFPRSKWIWFTAVALAPIAYWGGATLQNSALHDPDLRLEIDRTKAGSIAREYAQQLGWVTEGWRETMKIETDRAVYQYLRDHPGPAREAVEKVAGPASLLVRLRSTTTKDTLRVWMSPRGKIYGYRGEEDDSDLDPKDSKGTAESAMKVATSALRQRFPDRTYFEISAPETSTIKREGNRVTYRYTWRTRVPALPELDLRYLVDVRGDRVLRDKVDVTPSDTLKKQFKRSAFWGFLKGLFGFEMVVLAIFVLVRYVSRSLQKEISHRRALIAAILVAILLLCIGALSDEVEFGMSVNENIPTWLIAVLIGLFTFFASGLAGAAYAAIEGDLRELFPDKLTSVDVLLSGKLFSQNVAIAVVSGIAFGGWLFLASSLVLNYAGGTSLPLEIAEDSIPWLLSRAPWLILFASVLLSGLAVCLGGFVMPLAALQRFSSRTRILLALFLPLALTGMIAMQNIWLPEPASFLFGLLRLLIVFLAFWFVDLLTAMMAITAYQFASILTGALQMTDVWANQLEWILGAGALIGLAQIWSALRGRRFTDDEVRPRYARDIEERLSLQAEVSAAREAQLRLLPPEPPKITGLTIAASCQAADVVRGDFYDFFVLSPTRLGILITDGGGQGLTTALFIAFTKGFMMHRAPESASASDALRSLGQNLGGALGENSARSGICYAIIDTKELTLEYARTGDTPCLLIGSESDTAEHAVPVAEQSVGTFPNGNQIIFEGSIRIREGLRIMLYTDGLTGFLGRRGRLATDRWLLKRLVNVSGGAGELLAAVQREFASRRGFLRLRKIEPQDDITMVVLRVETVERATVFSTGERVA